MGEEIHFRTQPCLVVTWNSGRCQLFTDLRGTGASGRQWLGFVRGWFNPGPCSEPPQGGGTQMWRAGTASLRLLGCGEQGEGLGRFLGLAEFALFVPPTRGFQKMAPKP